MKSRLLALLRGILLPALLFGWGLGCEQQQQATPSPEVQAKRAASLRARAEGLGIQLAKRVVFDAQEINMLNPRSDRAKASRRARELLDEITGEPGSVPEQTSPDPTPPLPRKSP